MHIEHIKFLGNVLSFTISYDHLLGEAMDRFYKFQLSFWLIEILFHALTFLPFDVCILSSKAIGMTSSTIAWSQGSILGFRVWDYLPMANLGQ